ncbi:MAG: adenylate cyclase [Myxococcota bacterium]|jgi:adenylate cyclase
MSRREGVLLTVGEVGLMGAMMWVGASASIRPLDILFSPAPLVLCLIVALSTLRIDPVLCWLSGALAGGVYLWIAVAAVAVPTTMPHPYTDLSTHLPRAILYLLIGGAAAVATQLLRRTMHDALEMLEERNEIFRVFGQHVSPKVVSRLLQQRPGEETELRHDDHNGIISKFLGDGFMAVFGAPLSDGRDSISAVEAAESILRRLDEEIDSGALPPLQVGIGLHTGEAITGSVGSPRRREYTIIGDVVNLAARIEQLNKRFGSRLLVSEAVWRELGRSGEGLVVRDSVEIRGRSQRERIYPLS